MRIEGMERKLAGRSQAEANQGKAFQRRSAAAVHLEIGRRERDWSKARAMGKTDQA